ncbi:MAG: TetR/AcrR family transcriptional regulator [Chloroflexota bacterium]
MTAAVSDIAPRSPLTRERVLRAAVALADEGGIEAVSMRRLGQELGVEAMALYRHVRNKEELVDGVIDLVVGEIVPPKFDADWRSAMRKLSLAARAVMLRHAWAPSLIVDRPTIGPATLGHIERVMAILRGGGFSLDMAHHALHVLGSRILGFTQDPFNDAADPRPDPETAAGVARVLAISYPNLGELALDAAHSGALGGCDDDFEFAFSLDLILDGLERRRTAD